MATYVYCSRASEGAVELARSLNGIRLRRFDGATFWRKNRRIEVKPGDVVICWGASFPELDGIRVLNGAEERSKSRELEALIANGVSTVPYSKKPHGDFIPRSNYHVGGNDLLNPPLRVDFYVKKLDLVNEYRLHIFDGKSIRAGQKVPRVENPHPWVRSWDAGWKVNYDGFKSNKAMRSLAKAAVATLGLTFGAVDVGFMPNGEYVILEVNRAPGLEGNTIQAYATAINRWVEGKTSEEAEDDARRT